MSGSSLQLNPATVTDPPAFPLPIAVPAAAAGLAYLNARHGVGYDWPMLSSFVGATVRLGRAERRDKLNVYYELEALAKGTRADHPWIIFHGQTWTYKEAYDIILKYGTWLRGRGVQPGEVVAMDFVNSETFIWVWFGLWSIGAKPAFINYNLTGKPLMHTIKTSTARLVIVDEESKANFAEHVMAEHGFTPAPATATEGMQANFDFEMDQSEVPRSVKSQALAQAQLQGITATPQKKQLEIVFFDKHLADSILMLQPTRQPDSCRANQKLNSMAMLIYTSGTTGLPKPAVMSWGKVSNIVSLIITIATKFSSATAALSLFRPGSTSKTMSCTLPCHCTIHPPQYWACAQLFGPAALAAFLPSSATRPSGLRSGLARQQSFTT